MPDEITRDVNIAGWIENDVVATKILRGERFVHGTIDGSVDEAFASQDFRGDNIILDPAGNIYVAGDFIWHRLKPANGEIDPGFSALSSTDALYELDGVLFRYDSAGIRRITET